MLLMRAGIWTELNLRQRTKPWINPSGAWLTRPKKSIAQWPKNCVLDHIASMPSKGRSHGRSMNEVAEVAVKLWFVRVRLLYLKRCKHFFTASTAYGTACAAAMLGDQESMDRLRTGARERCRETQKWRWHRWHLLRSGRRLPILVLGSVQLPSIAPLHIVHQHPEWLLESFWL